MTYNFKYVDTKYNEYISPPFFFILQDMSHESNMVQRDMGREHL